MCIHVHITSVCLMKLIVLFNEIAERARENDVINHTKQKYQICLQTRHYVMTYNPEKLVSQSLRVKYRLQE